MNAVANVQVHEHRKSFGQLSDCKLLKRNLLHGISVSVERNSETTVGLGLLNFYTFPASVILNNDPFLSSDNGAGRFIFS